MGLPLFRPATFPLSRAGGGHESSLSARHLPQSRAGGGHESSLSARHLPQSRAGGGHESSLSARHSCDPGRAATMGLPLFRPTTFPLSRAGGGHGPSSISARNLPAIQGGRRPWAFLGTCVAVGTSATFADWRLHNVMDPIRGALVPLRATPERERARRRPMAADCPALCPKPAGPTKAHGRRLPGTLPETCGPGKHPWPLTAQHFLTVSGPGEDPWPPTARHFLTVAGPRKAYGPTARHH